ncbi:metalloregulator ArsR/SmtB family transcription factor [Neptunicella sp.]|uniref:metalloregulator ArsR/SmtB family transcription factor n=1 Tax=Neptunicella sp. TaxID=2125986 RepID=UPI003F68D482
MLTPLTFYKCLSEETRLKSLLLISVKRELCVCDLIQALGLSQPKISRHLAELRKCELLIDERRGKWVYYQLHPDLPQWAIQVLTTTANSASDYVEVELANLTTAANSCH